MGTHPFVAQYDPLEGQVENIATVDHLTIYFDRVPDRSDVALDAEHSSTLLPASFTTGGVITEVLSTTCGREHMRARIPVTPGAKGFLRLSAN